MILVVLCILPELPLYKAIATDPTATNKILEKYEEIWNFYDF